MAVHIRLARAGTKKKPFYRVVVTDQRAPRGGRFLEALGTFDPMKKAEDKPFTVNGERLGYWQSVGALTSPTVERLLKQAAKAAPAA